jgi:hypothetical protein
MNYPSNELTFGAIYKSPTVSAEENIWTEEG